MNKLFTDEELEYELQTIFYPEIKHFALSKKAIKLHKAVNLINTQKRLYAEMVVGEDCEGYHDDFDESQMCSYNNILRAEQRARIK